MSIFLERRGRWRKRFDRFFIVLSLVWFGAAFPLLKKRSDAARLKEQSVAKSECTRCLDAAHAKLVFRLDEDRARQDSESKALDLRIKAGITEKQFQDELKKGDDRFLAAMLIGIEEEEQASGPCVAGLHRQEEEIGERHANAWRFAFPHQTWLWSIAFLMVPPLALYGSVVGISMLSLWVWRGHSANPAVR